MKDNTRKNHLGELTPHASWRQSLTKNFWEAPDLSGSVLEKWWHASTSKAVSLSYASFQGWYQPSSFPAPSGESLLASPSLHCSIPVPTLPGDVGKKIAQEKGNGFSRKFYGFFPPKQEATQSDFDVVWLTKVVSRVWRWTSHTHISEEQKWERVLGRSKKHHHGLA